MSDITEQKLVRGLKNRHIQMIALGGAIGTGLFYGSAEAIQLAGPATILSYLIGGFVIYLIIRMLGEMSTEEPVAGAFSHFAYEHWGEFPGFLAGWNYWFLYVLVSMTELTVIGVYMDHWIALPHWVTSLVVLLLVTAINLVNVKAFGEFEFWFALVKILAVSGMIVFGAILIISNMGGENVSVANLWNYGGFFPMGLTGVMISLLVVMFAFGGTELIGIAAGEADNPQKSIPKAVRQVMWRILIFYIGAITVIMVLNPWNVVGKEGSPFVIIFEHIGIPSAGHILNFVVLTAAISVYNSGIYSNGRMLFSLAEQGNAPRIFTSLSKNKVPYTAILFSSICTFAAVIINYLVPNGAFMKVMAGATASAVITWSMIVLVHLRFRKKHMNTKLHFPAPFYPVGNYFCLAFLIGIVLLMFISSFLPPIPGIVMPNMTVQACIVPAWILVLYIGFRIKKGKSRIV